MLANSMKDSNVPLYLTDGGLETTLVFLDGYDLPEFAAFPLLETAEGRARLEAYYEVLPTDRRRATREACIPNDNFYRRLPLVDKMAGLMSLPIDAIYQLLQKAGRQCSLEMFCELILLTAWINSYYRLSTIYQR